MGLWERYVEWTRKRALARKPLKLWIRWSLFVYCMVVLFSVPVMGLYIFWWDRPEGEKNVATQALIQIWGQWPVWGFAGCFAGACVLVVPFFWLCDRMWNDRDLIPSSGYSHHLKRVHGLMAVILVFLGAGLVFLNLLPHPKNWDEHSGSTGRGQERWGHEGDCGDR